VLNAIWEEFLNIAKDEAGSRVVETWLKALSVVNWDARQKTIFLRAPNNFVKDWVNTHYLELLCLNLGRLLNVQDLKVVLTNLEQLEQPELSSDKFEVHPADNLSENIIPKYNHQNNNKYNSNSSSNFKNKSTKSSYTKNNYSETISNQASSSNNINNTIASYSNPTATSSNNISTSSAVALNHNNIMPAKIVRKRTDHSQLAQAQRGTPVNSAYRFDNFIIGPNNTLAHAAAQAVARQPGELYNPLFIYGNSGLGKTHLLHAIGNEIKVHNPHISVLYQTTDRFVSEFISAIRFNKVFAFKDKYRVIDVLLIDDIQFISNKDQTQEAFFHIFNALYEARKQIILTSDTYPSDMTGLTDRLRSRLEWGLITDIHVPALETKIAILKKKAEQHHELLSDEIACFIASKEVANIRELEGVLVRVLAFANLTHQQLSLELAQKVLGSLAQKTVVMPTTLERIVNSVGKYFAHDLIVLRSDHRGKDVVFARQVAMYMMKQLTDKSLREIGLYLNRKDHTTVSHAIDKISARLKIDSQLQQQIEQLIHEVNT
jgi:chromosomal replication initiator protein